MPGGSPRVVDPLVAFDCKVSQQSRIGAHHVFMGEVQDIFVAPHGTPLIYAHRAYGSPTRIDAAASIAAGRQMQGGRLSIACVQALAPFVLPGLLHRLTASGPVDLTLIEGDQRRVQDSLRSGEAELALLYDLNLPDDFQTVPVLDLRPHVVLAPDHPLAARGTVTVQDLAAYPMVLLTAAPFSDEVLAMLRDGGIEARVAYRSGSLEMVRGLVGQGLGYAILSTLPAGAQSYDGRPLVALPLTGTAQTGHGVLAARIGVPLSRLGADFARLSGLASAKFAAET